RRGPIEELVAALEVRHPVRQETAVPRRALPRSRERHRIYQDLIQEELVLPPQPPQRRMQAGATADYAHGAGSGERGTWSVVALRSPLSALRLHADPEQVGEVVEEVVAVGVAGGDPG